MRSILTVVIASVLVAINDTAYVDTLSKCDIDDTSCEKQLIETVIKDVSDKGLKELDIKPIDPLDISNTVITLLGLANITLTEGTATGVKDCVVDKITPNYKKGNVIIEVTCDINVVGKYKIEGNGPLVESMLGGKNIHGEGNIKAKVEKLHMKLQDFFDVIKKDDGNIYFKCDDSKFVYDYDLEGAKIEADKFFLGDEDATETVVKFVNENWKFVMKSFGKDIIDVAMKILLKTLNNFFDNTPTNKFLTTDLSPYVTN